MSDRDGPPFNIDAIVEILDHFVAPSAALLPRWEAVRGEMHSLSPESQRNLAREFLYMHENSLRWRPARLPGWMDGGLAQHLMVNIGCNMYVHDLQPMRKPHYDDLLLAGRAVAAIECEVLPVN